MLTHRITHPKRAGTDALRQLSCFVSLGNCEILGHYKDSLYVLSLDLRAAYVVV